MKKNIIKTLTLLTIVVSMVSCNKQPSKMDGDAANGEDAAQGIRIAYVEVDSIINQYELQN